MLFLALPKALLNVMSYVLDVGRCELCAQAKPVKQAYFGTGRRLQQGPEDGPPGAIPEGDAFAAETPTSAPGKDMAS